MAPIQIDDGPVRFVTGLANTVTGLLYTVSQPVLLWTNLKEAVPAPIPVTKPALLIDATAVVREIHVPPAVGVNCDV